MSSDEDDDFVPTASKRRTQTKIAAVGVGDAGDDDDDDDDDNLFADSEDDDEANATSAKNGSFSVHALNRELARFKSKDILTPPLDLDVHSMTSWDDVQEYIVTKKIELSNMAYVIKVLVDMSQKDDEIPLEFKFLVTVISFSSCSIYKDTKQSQKCQEYFKSKDKEDKSRYLANYVSNFWIQESLANLRASSGDTTTTTTASIDESTDLNVKIIQAGLEFIKSTFVIDSAKKLNVLKEKRNVDWQSLTEKILKFSKSKSLTKLQEASQSTQEYLNGVVDPNTRIASKVANAGVIAKPIARKVSLKEKEQQKRQERMDKMKSQARSTSIRQTSATPAASSVTPVPSLSAYMKIPRASRAEQKPQGPDESSIWHPKGTLQDPPLAWNPKFPNATIQSRPETLKTITAKDLSAEEVAAGRNDFDRSQRKTTDDKVFARGMAGASKSSLGRNTASTSKESFPSRFGPPSSGPSSSYGPPVSSSAPTQNSYSQSLDFQRSKRGPQNDQWKSSREPKRARQSNDHYAAADVPSGGVGRGRGRGRGANVNVPAWMSASTDSAQSLAGNGPPQIGRGPPMNASNGGIGRGRGRDMNRPAWLENGPDDQNPRNNNNTFSRPMPRSDAGRGRGANVNVPAWMANNNNGGGAPSGGFRDPGSSGGGRGRGRGANMNLPAWMTEKQNDLDV